jgi:hypothetical protein
VSAAGTLNRALVAGVRLEANHGKLAYDAPNGALAPGLVNALREHKGELLELLTHPLLPSGAPVKGICWKCGSPVTWRGELEGFRTLTMQFIHWRCPDA